MSKTRVRRQSGKSPGRIAQLACLAEVCAPKAGNVHPGASFDDATWLDFAVSAVAIAPALDRARERGVGATVLACVRATRGAIGHNTNLGMVLLLAPLCAVPMGRSLRQGVCHVLRDLGPGDAAAVYEAIRLAAPGGLGRAERGDVRRREARLVPLPEAMRLAAGRDAVARQYATGFADVFERVAPRLASRYRAGSALDEAIVLVHLQLMAEEPDSLIRRKSGDAAAAESARRARAALDAGFPATAGGRRAFARLDRWLRADGRKRNPGTSADLIAAGLFVAFREGGIVHPFRWSAAIAPE